MRDRQTSRTDQPIQTSFGAICDSDYVNLCITHALYRALLWQSSTGGSVGSMSGVMYRVGCTARPRQYSVSDTIYDISWQWLVCLAASDLISVSVLSQLCLLNNFTWDFKFYDLMWWSCSGISWPNELEASNDEVNIIQIKVSLASDFCFPRSSITYIFLNGSIVLL